MAITGISISQDNTVLGSNLMPVHSPLIFIIDVTYTGLVPDQLNVGLYDKDDLLLETYKCIPYNDLLATLRQFIFIADEPIRSLMNGFEDFAQLNETFLFVENITKVFKLKFVDPNNDGTFDEVTIDAVHGAEQFGNNPNLVEQFNNSDDNYFGPEDNYVYVYFYNDDITNVLGIGDEYMGIDPSILNVPIGGDTDTISVFASGSWLATEAETWISLTTPSGTGDGSFDVITAANGTGLIREGIVTVTQGAIIQELEVIQATDALVVTYDFDLTINVDIDTATSYRSWRLVDISPLDRTGNSINVGLDYHLNVVSITFATAAVWYGIGPDAVTEPTTWILIKNIKTPVNGGSNTITDTTTIEVADGEFLFVRNVLSITGEVTDSSIVNLDLIDGSVVLPGTGTVTASGSPLDWDKTLTP